MKKVGIATFHYADNYGAVLQCYALQKVLNRFDKITANLINYIPNQYRYPRIWKTEYEHKQWLNKREAFDNFLKKKCEMDSRTVSTITGEGYDALCVGSDQIWNPFSNTKEYFLPNVSAGIKKISYAASIGCSVVEAEKNKKQFSRYLAKFDSLSVREIEHQDFVTAMSGKECSCVIDPTLLINESEYINLIGNREEDGGEYIFFYWLQHSNDFYKVVPIVNKIAAEKKLKVKHTLWNNNGQILFPDSECVIYSDIERFLCLIKNATFVITNSYHGTILSLKFHIPFYTYVDKNMSSRFKTLDSYIDIKSRIINWGDDCQESELDYLSIERKIGKKKEESLLYLKQALEL
ncbi:Polysaccharide pyruvyl transferase [Pseudobutyrivibrio sp. UC1225]|uniref:polysaccharide pyruvyl transferase family protein n=1 Tax=Pseudobutyrivibrio sp. UC1225 TaxID=1798185 RepID=UPI0008F1A6DF|nr:polysaccharide pyruvyl transferase family protein [Pseudobutyrivibrio sp. UC1225]SFO06961.1 Polysaccharide pyruvyl transferase [Pseudobutyrivibrio sp. UC1225]